MPRIYQYTWVWRLPSSPVGFVLCVGVLPMCVDVNSLLRWLPEEGKSRLLFSGRAALNCCWAGCPATNMNVLKKTWLMFSAWGVTEVRWSGDGGVRMTPRLSKVVYSTCPLSLRSTIPGNVVVEGEKEVVSSLFSELYMWAWHADMNEAGEVVRWLGAPAAFAVFVGLVLYLSLLGPPRWLNE